MKKIFILAILFAMTFSLFAANYKVVSVTGKVTYEVGPDTWKQVEEGQELESKDFLNTSLNSSLVILTEDGKRYTIKAMQKGTVDSLVTKIAKKGLKTTSIADDIEGTSKGIATASSRASEAKQDIDWDE